MRGPVFRKTTLPQALRILYNKRIETLMASFLAAIRRCMSMVFSYLILSLGLRNVLALPLNESLRHNDRFIYCPRIVGKGLANELLSFRSSLLFAIKMEDTLCYPSLVDGKTLSRRYKRIVSLSQIFDVDFLESKLPIKMISCNSNCAKPCASFNFERMETLLRSGKWQTKRKLRDTCSQSAVEGGYFVELNPWISYFEDFATDYAELQTYLRSPTYIRILAQELISEVFQGHKYLALHWRFEETKCKGFLGTCVRSLFASRDHFTVTQGQLKAGIKSFITSFNISTMRLYVASDACLRGKCHFLHDTLKDFPSFTARDLLRILKTREVHWREASLEFALLEQEICAYSLGFMGMSKSSWSWDIFLKRSVLAGDMTEVSMMSMLNFRHPNKKSIEKWHNASGDGFFDLHLLFQGGQMG